MGNEASKVKLRVTDLLVDPIIDIGYGEDKITTNAVGYDKADGNAETCSNLEPESFATVFSSHCLEHMKNPLVALSAWWKLLKPFGFMIIYVPDEDLYEQGQWPSTFNSDHKHSFTPSKSGSWSPKSLNIIDLIKYLPDHKLYSLRVLDTGYDYTLIRNDQTTAGAEAHIELILQKLPTGTVPTAPGGEILKHTVIYI